MQGAPSVASLSSKSRKSSSMVGREGQGQPRHHGSATQGHCTCTTTPSWLTRTVLLRGAVLVSLLTAAAVCAKLSHSILQETESQVGYQTYESIASAALTGASAITSRKLQGSVVMAEIMSQAFPDRSDWPLGIHMTGYIPVATAVADLSSSTTQSVMVLLQPNETQAFEEMARAEYEREGRPEMAGYSDFGFGIWKPDSENDPPLYNDGRLHDTQGVPTSWDNQHDILATILWHNQPAAKSLLLNVYAIENRGVHVDSMLNCVQQAARNSTKQRPECTVVTDMLTLVVRPGPAALLFHPIFPANDADSTMVGFSTTSIHWQEVLENVVPDYVSGLRCVISTDSKRQVTFEIRDGLPVLIDEEAAVFDAEYAYLARSVVLNDIVTGAATTAKYTLTVYPTEELLYTFSTNTPLAVALGFFGVIIFCTLVFFAYDALMRYEVYERKQILEMKRLFVRFISHEIRTPLNTVCMGLELLESDLTTNSSSESSDSDGDNNNDRSNSIEAQPLLLQSQDKSENSNTQAPPECAVVEGDTSTTTTRNVYTKKDVEFWHTITTEVQENALVAVAILNDLLNFDKLESGTMQLEKKIVPIWDFVESTVKLFHIQSVNRNINLKIHMERPHNDKMKDYDDGDIETGSGLNLYERLCVIGDDVRIGQVIRNVVSNALKFTPPQGTIDVTVTHVPNALPHAVSLKLDSQEEEDETKAEECFPRAGAIRILVKDSGVGLTKEQLKAIFQEGVQFDANRLQHGGGSGLGLSIAKGIVEQHSGTIAVTSEGQGRGTTFHIDLPLCLVPGDIVSETKLESGGIDTLSPLATAVPHHTTSGGGNVPVHKRRLLVVEDTMSCRKMLIRLLERAGHTCIQATNGEEAVAAVQRELEEAAKNPEHVPLDTILMDYEMPLMRGPDATEHIRRMGFRGTILGVTGNVLLEDVTHFKSKGADEVLAKPVSLDRINDYWNHHKAIKHATSKESFGSYHKQNEP